MKKPLPEEYNISPEELAYIADGEPLYKETDSSRYLSMIMMLLSLVSAILFGLNGDNLGDKISQGITACFGTFIILFMIKEFINIFIPFKTRKPIEPLYTKVQRYQNALKEYNWSIEQYWKSLSGLEFESDLADLYRKLGYFVRTTPKSGDEGIDLILDNNKETIIVQCKAHKKPIGVVVARELYGVMIDYGANSAILASTGGFTRGVRQFVVNKPIKLVSISQLIKMTEFIKSK